MNATYFASGRAFRAGLTKHHDSDTELLLGFYKKDSGRGGITYAAALEAIMAVPDAWTFYQAQASWYQRTASHWVLSAKKPETRARRLAALIDHARKGERIPPLAFSRTSRKQNDDPPAPDYGVVRFGLGPSWYSFGGSTPSRFLTK
jgi:hypothetical protein